MDVGNIVVVQGKSGGVEYGKYIVPLVSSHLPFGGDFNLGTAQHIEGSGGLGAEACDYRKGQQQHAADAIQPFASGTVPAPSAAGSHR